MTQDPKKVTPEQIAELRAALDAHFRVRSPAARERAIDLFFQNHIALLDAAERCALADEHGALALGLAFAQARQDLTAAIARAEAAEKERDRMRPVVEAAVAEYRAADAANDETEPDDTQVQRNGRWAKAETTLHIAVHNYLDGAHAKGGG